MRRVVLTALAAASVAIGVWLAVGGPGARDRQGESGGGDAPPAANAPPGLAKAAGAGSTEAVGKGRIRGRVLAGDRPVAAVVESRRKARADEEGEPPVESTAAAGEDGRFAIEAIPVGTWLLHATTPDGRKGWAWAEVPLAGAAVEVRIPVERPQREHALRGRVVHADGRPWGGIVRVEDRPAVRPDGEGRFVVEGLREGTADVWAVDPGRLRVYGPSVRIPSDLEYVLVVDERLRELTGRVVAAEDGRGIAGAIVTSESWLPGDGRLHGRAFTDADGSFRVPIEAEDGGTIAAVAEGRCGLSRRLEAAETAVRLTLPRPGRLVARVVTVDGRPLPRATVRIRRSSWLPGGATFSYGSSTVVTDERGMIETGVPPGDVQAWVFGPGWTSEGLDVVLDTGVFPIVAAATVGGTATVEIRAVPAPSFTGHVVDADGRPVVGALVDASLLDVAHERRHLIDVFAPPKTVTGEGGAFTTSPLIAGRAYVLNVEAGGVADLHVRNLRAPASGALEVTARLPSPRALRVLVKDEATGAAIEGATVYGSWSPDAAESPWSAWTLTDEGGTALLDGLPAPGNWCSVVVKASGYEEGQVSPEKVGAAVVALQRSPGATLEGRVEYADAAVTDPLAVAGVLVEADREDLVTDAQGRWRVGGLDEGEEVRIRAARTWHGISYEATFEVPAGSRDVVVSLRRAERQGPSPRILVRVLDGSGNPVPWASVRWSNENFASALVTDGKAYVRDSRWARAGEDVESTTLEVFGARGYDGRPLDLAAATGIVVAEDAREVEVRLLVARSIEGRVTTDDDRGVAGVAVRAAKSFEGYRPQATATATTDATGAFRLGGLGDDEYVVLVDPPRGFATPSPLRVRGGEAPVLVRLRSAVSARVRVLDAGGAPLPGTRIRYAAGGEPPQTDAAGICVLSGLDPKATYTLHVEHPSSNGPGGLPLYVHRGWAPSDVEVRLDPALVVRGRVVDPQGRIVDGATVWGRGAVGDWWSVTANDAGAFALPLLPAGRVTLCAGLEGSTVRSPDTVVESGRGEVVLTLDTGPEIAVRIDGWNDEGGGAHLYRMGASDPEASRAYRSIDSESRVRFRGLAAGGRYALWVRPSEDGRSVLALDLKPGPSEIVLRFAEGRRVAGTVAGAEEVRRLRVDLVETQSGVSVYAETDDAGAFESDPLPPGRWVAKASATRDGKPVKGEASAVPGGPPVEITLREGE